MKYDASIDGASLSRLRGMWKNANYWMNAANGKNPMYKTMRDRILARDIAIKALSAYEDFLDGVVDKRFPKDRPREAA